MIFERGLGIGERQGIAIGKTHASDDLRGDPLKVRGYFRHIVSFADLCFGASCFFLRRHVILLRVH